jgi:hypothetical protein
MMKRLLSLILFVLLMTTTIITAQDTQAGDCAVRASNDFARVRTTWNLEADEIARIGATDTARYVARGKNASEGFTWYYIGIGWVRADVVNATGNCDNLPVVFTRVNSAFRSDLYPCPADFSGYLAPRLASGQTAITVNDYGTAYFVYALPETTASIVGFIANNEQIDRIGIGPLCHDGAVFWEAFAGTLSGFVMESNRYTNQYYLSTTALTVDPAPNEQTNSDTLETTVTPTLNTPYKIYEGSPAETLLFNSDSRLLAGLTYPAERAIIWDVVSDQYYLLAFPTPIIKAQFGTDAHQLLTADENGQITTWDVTTQTSLNTVTISLPENAETFTNVAFSPEGVRVALSSCTEPTEDTCNRSTITISDVETGAQAAQVARQGKIHDLALSPYGNALAISDGDDVVLWTDVVNDPFGSRNVPTFNITLPTTLTFNPSGTRLLVAGCQETRLIGAGDLGCSYSLFGAWTVDANVIESMRGQIIENTLSTLSVAGDNEVFVTHTADSIGLYQLADGTRIRSYHSTNPVYQTAVIAPDGKLIASADGAGKIMLWNR